MLLTTPKGSREMFPDYGTNLRSFLFEQNDDVTQSDIENEIKNAVKKYFKAVTISEIQSQNDDFDKSATIYIVFAYNDTSLSYTDSLTLRFTV